MDELGEVARAGRSGVDVPTLHRQFQQYRLDAGYRLRVAASHEAGAGARAFDATAGAEIDEVEAALGQPLVAANRVAPVGIAGVDDDVAHFEVRGEVVDDRIHDRAGRNVDEERARWREVVPETLEPTDLRHSGVSQLIWRRMHVVSNDAYPLFERVQDEVAAHAAEADDAEFLRCALHISSFPRPTTF